MFCPKCKIHYPEGVTVCADCGTLLTPEPAPPVEAGKIKRRNPFVAFLLSFFCRGLGQLYNGQLKRAVVFFSLELILSIMACILFRHMLASFDTAVTALTIIVSIGIAFMVFVAVDAYRGASRTRELKLKRYNRWYIYVALMLASIYLINPTFSLLITRNFKAYTIGSSGMKPALLVGDHLGCDVTYWRAHKPQRGDLVIFINPEDRTNDLLKRVIAVEGETIEIRDKRVYIDGQKIEDPWGVHLESTIIAAHVLPRDNMAPVRIPEDSVFVLGDNRDRSLDSRFWGPVDMRDLTGRPLYIYWAKDRHRIGMSLK